jgi:hypothetical protein
MVRTLSRLVALGVVGWLPACVDNVQPRTPSQLIRDEVEAVESGEQYEAPASQATVAQGTALTRVLGLRARLDPSDRKEADDWIAGHLTMFAGRPHVPRSQAKVLADAPRLPQVEEGFVEWEVRTRYDRQEPQFARALFLLPPNALPELDRFALGTQGLEYGTSVAPEVRAAFAIYCARSPGMADRLVAWLASRHDPPLLKGFFDAMLARGTEGLCSHPRWSTNRPVGELARLWTASAWWPEVWTAIAHALTTSGVQLDDPRVRSLVHQAWLTWPERRGSLLALIGNAATSARTFRGPDPGAAFERMIGPRPTRKELAAMLALGPETLPALPQVCRALGAATHGKGGAKVSLPRDLAARCRAPDPQPPLPAVTHEC